jgi:hypothetical protein
MGHGETQPQTQSYCSKSDLGLGLAFSIEPPPDVPDMGLCVYAFMGVKLVRRCAVALPPDRTLMGRH